MKKVIRMTESDLATLIKKVINEQRFDKRKPMSIFYDKEERKIAAANLLIKKVSPDNVGFVVDVETDPGLVGGETFKGTVRFNCSNPKMYAEGMIQPPTVNPKYKLKPTFMEKSVYSKQLSDVIYNEYCVKDKRFAPVEKKYSPSTQSLIDRINMYPES